MKPLATWAAALTLVVSAGSAEAALTGLGNGTVLDTNTNLIWLQDWDVNGQQNWAAQKAWAETTLDGFAGSSDWRLPSITEYLALSGAYGNLTSNALPFVDVKTDAYWSGTERANWAPGDIAWGFYTGSTSFASEGYKTSSRYAVAVRTGNVTASVAEPQTLALTLLALGGAGLAMRRRGARAARNTGATDPSVC
jgi:hypothetical protein